MNQEPIWLLRTRELNFSGGPLVMGILNVTPDSFSDGGRFAEVDAAVEHGLRLAAEGADILDVGGESTRPYSQPVELQEELRRTIEVVRRLAARVDIPVSIDTSKAEVARQALDVGAEIINDVTGLEGDPLMQQVAWESQAGLCVMHMQGNPRTMQDLAKYENVVDQVVAYLKGRRDKLIAAGIDARRICLDPGIGFGKKTEHNVQLLRACSALLALEAPILIGHSRKGFLGKLIGDDQADRLAAGLAVSLAMAQQGVHVLRVHDVAPLKQALTVYAALTRKPEA